MAVIITVLGLGHGKWQNFQHKIRDPKSQGRLVLMVVRIALLLVNMPYMVTASDIPNYLTQQTKKQDETNYPYRYYNKTHSSDDSIGVTHSFVLAHKLDPSGQFKNGDIVNVPEDAILSTNNSYHPDHHGNRIYLPKIPVTLPPVSNGDEGLAIGVLFTLKAVVQFCVNPFTAVLIDRIGYDIPMTIGLAIIFLSTFVFAF